VTSVTVSGLALSPVKGLRVGPVQSIQLERDGVRANRRFFLIDERDRMVNAKVVGELTTIVATYSDADRRLSLTLPDGRVVSDRVTVGEQLVARFFSRALPGRVVGGPFAAAISEVAGLSLRLLEAPDAGGAVDRGATGAVSLISRASLARMASAADVTSVDGRRFRMLIEVDGAGAHEEDRWVGRRVSIGDAVVAFVGHVGRCLVTSRDPETGQIDLPTLDLIRSYRGDLDSTEPLPFGIWGQVLAPGAVRVGDHVTPGDRLPYSGG
jgi:uncharacterized protein YcbX